MKVHGQPMRTLWVEPDGTSVGIIDQTRLPHAFVTLRLTRDRTVVWGSPERGDRKATVLTALMSRRADVYDVSAPDAPTTRRG